MIENRYGGSGAVTMRAVLGRKADGYTVLVAPATFISTVQITQSDFGRDDFYFLACLTEAPEALIMGDASIFFTRPVSAVMLALAVLSFSLPFIRRRTGKQQGS